jgi:hypothetical protein
MRISRIAAALAGAVVVSACSSTVSGHGVAAPGAATGSAGSGVSSAPSTKAGSNGRLSANELAATARRAMLAATAFRMKGSGKDSDSTITFDMHYGVNSSDGTLGIDGASVRVRYVSKQVYMNGTRQFWQQVAGAGKSVADQATLALLQGKWVRLPPNTPGLSDIGQFAIRTKMLAQAASQPDNSTYTKGPSKVIRGIPAVSVVDSSDGSFIYVPATGTPYPIHIEDHGNDPGTFDLSEWNVPFSAVVPPASEIVDLPR